MDRKPEILLSIQEFVDNHEELRWVFFARVMPDAWNGHDLGLRQNFAKLCLSRGGYDRAAASQYINDGRLDFSHEPPEFGGHETVSDCGIALPDDAAVGPMLGSVANVGSKNVFAGSRAAGLLLCQ